MAYTFPQINGTVLVQFCSPGSICNEEIHVHGMEESIQSINVAWKLPMHYEILC